MTNTELEEKKMELFKAAIKAYKIYEDTENTTKAKEYWMKYTGFYTAIQIMDWTKDFHKEYGEVLVP